MHIIVWFCLRSGVCTLNHKSVLNAVTFHRNTREICTPSRLQTIGCIQQFGLVFVSRAIHGNVMSWEFTMWWTKCQSTVSFQSNILRWRHVKLTGNTNRCNCLIQTIRLHWFLLDIRIYTILLCLLRLNALELGLPWDWAHFSQLKLVFHEIVTVRCI